MSGIRVIWKAKSKEDKLGYLRLSSRVAGKTVIRNLPLDPIDKKHFNSNTQRLRTSFKEHEHYNNTIEKKLKELEGKGSKIKLINNDKKSFLSYMNNLIDLNPTNNSGTKIKYTNIKNVIVDFHTKNFGDTDIKFTDINVEYLEKFRSYLRERGNNENTIFYKFKTFKSFTNKAERERHFTYELNPFDLIELSLESTKITPLNKEELMKLKETQLVEVYRSRQKFGVPIPDLSVLNSKKYEGYISLDTFRNFFLFQLFSQGIRVSDLMTLRWCDFEVDVNGIRVDKKMVKVKENINFLINNYTAELLINFIPIESISDEEIKSKAYNLFYNKIFSQKQKFKIDDSDFKIDIDLDINDIRKFKLDFITHRETTNDIKKFHISLSDIDTNISKRELHLRSLIRTKNEIKINNHIKGLLEVDDKTKYLKELREIVSQKLISVKEHIKTSDKKTDDYFYDNLKVIIDSLKYDNECKNMFVFPLLSNEDFKYVKDFRQITEEQYTQFTGRRTYYNRILKIIAIQCGVKKNLTTHLARHSYTSLMIEIGENLNLFDLMQSLGHKSLKTTQGYIAQFSSKRVDELNLNIVNYLK
ncbi:site-specific integrase [Flavobacterium enshiense]|uniref:phage integrase SAM-like domain-containing protein n=1 Tax=Flavobacterium enshiense TaxID=1341165 RepID=UPI00345D3759